MIQFWNRSASKIGRLELSLSSSNQIYLFNCDQKFSVNLRNQVWDLGLCLCDWILIIKSLCYHLMGLTSSIYEIGLSNINDYKRFKFD